MSDAFNLREGELAPAKHADDGAHRYMHRGLGRERGAKRASWSVYELAPGSSATAFHYEVNREEWILVIAGEVTVRGADGERALRPGDVACFPPGAEGVHTFRNDGAGPARYAMLSNVPEHGAVVVYPDSRRVYVPGLGKMPIGEDAPYWEGER